MTPTKTRTKTIRQSRDGGDVVFHNDQGGTEFAPIGTYEVEVYRSWNDYETGRHYAGLLLNEADRDRFREAGRTEFEPKKADWNPGVVFFVHSAIVKAPKTFFRVSLDTRHFQFEAFGATQEAALEAFQQGWAAHAKASGAAAFGSSVFTRELLPDITCSEIQLGACYRDNGKITPEVK